MQEPPELALEFHRRLAAGDVDVVFGHRTRRTDGWWSQLASQSFWSLYRRFVVKDMPKGGIDMFGCTRQVRDRLLELTEVNTNLIALLFWLGFRRGFVPYERRARAEGRSGWTLGRKIGYALDSIFSFTDLPIRALLILGAFGTTAAVIGGATVFVFWLLGRVPVLGYTPLMLVITFFGGLTALGLGIIGQYLWLSLQNARRRPNFVVKNIEKFGELTIAIGIAIAMICHCRFPISDCRLPRSCERVRIAPMLEQMLGTHRIYVHPQALCESRSIGENTRIWAFAHVLPGATIGAECNVCDHVFIENDVVIGDRVTIKCGVQLWDGLRVGDDVFIGPNATFSNDKYPRSKQHHPALETHIGRGASIGGGAVVLPGLRIGARAMVGAGAVVTHDIPARAIVSGNPARIVGYVDTQQTQSGRARCRPASRP